MDIIETIPSNKYLLVSDSNEVTEQFDSKKLRQDELSYLAEENLFKKHLGIMSNYLTVSQYASYRSILKEKYIIQKKLFEDLDGNVPVKFRPVDGQIILLQQEETDKRIQEICTQENLTSMSPLDYLKRHWDITTEFTVEQIYDCMLRGVTEIDPNGGDKTKRDGNLKVGLTDDNMPIHMHNSGVTTGGSINCMHGGEQVVGFRQGETVYDMFYNDSFTTGVDKNELDGVVDDFVVQDSGVAEQSDSGNPRIMHNNLPVYKKFYAFVVRKNIDG